MSYNRRSTILGLREEGVLLVWHDYRFGHTVDFSGNGNSGVINATGDLQFYSRQGLEFPAGAKELVASTISVGEDVQALSVVFGLRSLQARGAASRVFIELGPTFTSVQTGFAVFESGGNLNFSTNGNVGISTATIPGSGLPGGVFGYLGATFDKSQGSGDEVKAFLDGELASTPTASVDNTNTFTASNDLYVGARVTTTLPSESLIQGVVLVQRALTDDEHRAVYRELAYP